MTTRLDRVLCATVPPDSDWVGGWIATLSFTGFEVPLIACDL